jgi:hypothetical protein
VAANGWGLKVVDYFTPWDQQELNDDDLDLGSCGVTILPSTAGSAQHRNLLVVAGKQGVIYLIDRDSMGKFNPRADHVPAEFRSSNFYLMSSPAFFGSTLYYAAAGDSAKAFKVSKGQINPNPISQTRSTFPIRGATPMISSDNGSQGILWLLDMGTNDLRAYKAGNLKTLLYTSSQAPNHRDQLGNVVKFTVPTIANGKVYVGTSNSLVAYGLLPRHQAIFRARQRKP